MLLRKLLLSLLLGFIVFQPGQPVRAQEVQKIVAIVNEDIISGYDVIQRISLRILMGGFPDNAQTRQQLVPSTINNLIDDRLKAQEAARYNLTASDGEINSAIERFEKRLNIRPGMAEPALASKNISIDALIDQINVTIAWDKVVRRRVIPRVNVTEEEIKAEQDRMRANKGKNEYLLREIFLPVDLPTDETKVSNGALSLHKQLKEGASFTRAAGQFSQGPTAAKGGAVGWFMAEDLDPVIGQAVVNLKAGSISDPIRTADGYYIMKVESVRQILSDKAADSRLQISQIALPVAPAKQKGLEQNQAALALSVSRFVDSCSYMPTMFSQLINNQSGPMGTVALSQLPEHIRDLVKDLKTGEASAPYLDKNIYRVFIVCNRQDANTESDAEEAVRQKLGRERIEARVNRYLNDLRREAVIESR